MWWNRSTSFRFSEWKTGSSHNQLGIDPSDERTIRDVMNLLNFQQLSLTLGLKKDKSGPGWVRTSDQAVMSRALCH